MLKNLEPYELPDGTWTCDLGFTQEDWMKVLNSEKCTMQHITTLAVFLRSEDHKSTCTAAAKISKVSTSASIRNRVTHFGQIARDVINRVKINQEDGSNTYWLFPMTGKELSDGHFEWRLRDELASALLQYIKGLQKAFVKEFSKDSLSNMSIQDYTNLDKTSFCYKLEFGLDILGGISGSTAFKFGIYKANNAPKMHDGVKFEEGYAWQERFGDTYRKAYNAVRRNVSEIARLASKNRFEDIEDIELADTVKWKIAYLYSNRKIIPIFNIDMLSRVADSWGMKDAYDASYTELQTFLLEHQNDGEDDLEFYYRTLRDAGNTSEDADEDSTDGTTYYLAGFTFNNGGDQLQRFIDEGVWEGSGPKNVNAIIEDIRKGDLIILKSTSTKGPKHDKPFLRVYGAMRVLSEKPEKKSTNYRVKTEFIPIPQKDFDGNKFGRYRQTIHLCNDDTIIEYVNQFLNSGSAATSVMDCSKYIDQLKRSHNLILTGAPGTGKTFLAKAIAEQMGAEWDMVQFHPSYDYTDFVEGIRPVKGENAFARKDGSFKEFCKKALKNLSDSVKSKEALAKEQTLEEMLESYIEEAIDSNLRLETATHKHPFFIIDNQERNIKVQQTVSKDAERHIPVSKTEILAIATSGKDLESMTLREVADLFENKHVRQQDTYLLVIAREIHKLYEKSLKTLAPSGAPVAQVKKKNFVFIIDEINRGEISKIFGELFFSVDPGYRGIKGKVRTQYQNLVDEDDVYYNGFYVPENVYILGTMNDIDRSVESMDFAIRRRFAWREILPEERIEMWDGKIDSFKDEAEERMSSLNKEIANPANGLGPEYCIGPAYFLHLSKEEYNGDFESLWEYNLKGVLNEYLRGNRDAQRIMSSFEAAYNLESGEDEAGNTDN